MAKRLARIKTKYVKANENVCYSIEKSNFILARDLDWTFRYNIEKSTAKREIQEFVNKHPWSLTSEIVEIELKKRVWPWLSQLTEDDDDKYDFTKAIVYARKIEEKTNPKRGLLLIDKNLQSGYFIIERLREHESYRKPK